MSNINLPSTMQAMQLTGFGSVDQLQLVDVSRPEPGAEEVLIKVGACGLNNTDLNLRKGWYSDSGEAGWQQTAPSFPIIQGADIVGEVVGVGGDVSAERLGERVIVNPTIYKDHPDNPTEIDFVGSECPGGFAQYVCVPAMNAYRIVSDLTDAELATFSTAYLTAWHMLAVAQVVEGETVLVTGASGGVGSALVQLALARNAEVIAVVGEGKAHYARQLGAKHIVSRDTTDWQQALGEYAVDVVADVVGGQAIAALIETIKPGGRIVVAGAIAGPVIEIDLRRLYLRHIKLIGSTLGTASDFEALVNAIERGQVKPLLAETFPLKRLRDAQEVFESKKYFGKIVIVP